MTPIFEERQAPLNAMEDLVHGIVARTRNPWLLAHHNHRLVLAAFCGLSCLVSIGLIAGLAQISRSLYVFPALGSTAFLLFNTPAAASAAPRSALLGHAVAVVGGLLGLWLARALAGPGSIAVGWPAVVAAALALGIAAGGMVLLDAPHPPAAATALLIAMGALTQPMAIAAVFAGIVLLLLQALVIHRLAGTPYPLWARASA